MVPGESIIICGGRDWLQLQSVLRGGLAPARSALRSSAESAGLASAGGGAAALLLSGVALGLATTRPRLRDLLACTLLAVTGDETYVEQKGCFFCPKRFGSF